MFVFDFVFKLKLKQTNNEDWHGPSLPWMIPVKDSDLQRSTPLGERGPQLKTQNVFFLFFKKQFFSS